MGDPVAPALCRKVFALPAEKENLTGPTVQIAPDLEVRSN